MNIPLKIFFTSKIADKFILDSFEYRLLIDNNIDDIFVEEIDKVKGTTVRFEINSKSTKHLNDIFMEYQSDPDAFDFDKTKVHIKLYRTGTVYISRSQARRITANLGRFKTVILDFQGIKSIGQSFADEVFRVFASKYRGVVLESVNTNETIDFMINRARGRKQNELLNKK